MSYNHTRFLLIVDRQTSTGSTYPHIIAVREFRDADWPSQAHMRRRFRDICRRQHAVHYQDPTRKIRVEAVLSESNYYHTRRV